MRLFKYKVSVYVPDSENQLNYVDKGMIQVEDVAGVTMSNKEIKKEIIRLFYADREDDILKFKLKQIPIITNG